jgi:hypothetical protein
MGGNDGKARVLLTQDVGSPVGADSVDVFCSASFGPVVLSLPVAIGASGCVVVCIDKICGPRCSDLGMPNRKPSKHPTAAAAMATTKGACRER